MEEKKCVDRDELMKYMDSVYLPFAKDDFCHNGLQIEGSKDVSHIVCGVTISKRLIEAALERQAEMIVVHHGLFTFDMSNPPRITGYMKDRLKLILENEVNLVGYHLSMDAHPEVGHNSLACKMLGLENVEGCDVGFIGDMPHAQELDVLVEKVEEIYERRVDVFAFGPKDVNRVAVISGGASSHWQTPYRLGADLFITGDMREENVRKFEEIGLNVINAGHYHTERLGILKLVAMLHDKFNIPVDFVEVETYV